MHPFWDLLIFQLHVSHLILKSIKVRSYTKNGSGVGIGARPELAYITRTKKCYEILFKILKPAKYQRFRLTDQHVQFLFFDSIISTCNTSYNFTVEFSIVSTYFLISSAEDPGTPIEVDCDDTDTFGTISLHLNLLNSTLFV